MAYREVRRMDIDQVIRRWLAGEKIRAIARSTGADRNTVRRIVRFAEKEGIGQETPWPDEGKLQVIRQRMGRPGAAVAASQAEQLLKPRTEQIRTWPDKDHPPSSKVHELLGREGLAVCYSSLYRFARKWCDFELLRRSPYGGRRACRAKWPKSTLADLVRCRSLVAANRVWFMASS